jgi:hypothetical protein
MQPGTRSGRPFTLEEFQHRLPPSQVGRLVEGFGS